MKSAGALVALVAAALAFGTTACERQQGERKVEYEYVYHEAAKPVAVASATPFDLAASPSKGAAVAKVTIVESSDFQ